MRGRRRLAGAIVAVSLIGLIVSVVFMAMRVQEHLRTSPRRLYVYKPVDDRRFTFAGRPVTLTDRAFESGNTEVVVRYGERELLLPAALPPGPEKLPGLARHTDWLRVLRFAERGRGTIQEWQRAVDAGEIADRLVIVVRRPLPGADPQSYGSAWSNDWRFELHELLPDGTIRTERRRFPESSRAYYARVKAARGAGDAAPPRRADDLEEGTWQFEAALHVMPRGRSPSPTFRNDAVGAMGWTLPAAGLSGLVLVLSAAWAFAPLRRRAAAGADRS